MIAENLSEEEIKGLKQMFKNMDTDGSGTITFDELRSGLHRLGSKLTESEIKQLMDAVRTEKKKKTNPCKINHQKLSLISQWFLFIYRLMWTKVGRLITLSL